MRFTSFGLLCLAGSTGQGSGTFDSARRPSTCFFGGKANTRRLKSNAKAAQARSSFRQPGPFAPSFATKSTTCLCPELAVRTLVRRRSPRSQAAGIGWICTRTRPLSADRCPPRRAPAIPPDPGRHLLHDFAEHAWRALLYPLSSARNSMRGRANFFSGARRPVTTRFPFGATRRGRR